MGDPELQEVIHEVLLDGDGAEDLSLEEKIRLSRELFNTFRKLDLLQELLEDEEITEIMINGPEKIFLEKQGQLYRSCLLYTSRCV